jgi:acyl-CoA synthetase (AMP-forming)/AMP-acid ligase II
VLCSHRARDITAHTVMVEEAIDERDVVAIVTPLFHVAALNIMYQPAILAGAATVFITRWSAAAFMEATDKHGITASFMVPTQASTLVRDPDFDANSCAPAQAVVCRRADAGLQRDLKPSCRACC